MRIYMMYEALGDRRTQTRGGRPINRGSVIRLLGTTLIEAKMTTTAILSDRPQLALANISNKAIWTGRMLTALAVLFLTFDTLIKVLALPAAAEATTRLGFPANAVLLLGMIEAACLVLYLTRRTAVLGAVLWTGYLGGAIATHVRLADAVVTHTLFPLYVAALLWLGLWLRDARFRHTVRAAFGAVA